jgi:hypothetical protein
MSMVVNPGVACIPARGPFSTPTKALYQRTAVLGGSTIVVIEIGGTNAPFRKVGLTRIKAKRVAGTGANFTPRIFSQAGITTAGDIAEEYAGTATAVGTLFNPTISEPIVMQCDEYGRLYLMLAPDAGADNTFDICLRFFVYE